MELTFNYLRTVWQNARQSTKAQPIFAALLLVLLALPFGYGVISVALMLLGLVSIIYFKKVRFAPQPALWLPVFLFVLMALSLCWTQDWDGSLKALQKGIPLILIPFCVMTDAFSANRKRSFFDLYALGMSLFSVFVLARAGLRYADSGNGAVFFYHELVTEDVNAIHVSVYMALAFCALLSRGSRPLLVKLQMLVLAVMLVLLSSKNIMVVTALLGLCYFGMNRRINRRGKWLLGIVLGVLLLGLAFFGKIKDRFADEFQREGSLNTEVSAIAGGNVYNVGVLEAWRQERFNGNDYFAGTAFRVYQLRIFFEMMYEDNAWLTGYGLNATDARVQQKGQQYGVYAGTDNDGYQSKNFHNQYVQLFAELGVLGFLLLLALLWTNLKNAWRSKDFVHISFAILMISLFLTESFLSRQRGIVFFTAVYCLLNARPLGTALPKE